MGRQFQQVIDDSQILQRLADFDARVAGTPPLGLAVAGSDIDILCHAPDPLAFAQVVWRDFAEREGFAMHQWSGAERPVIARFVAGGWPIEIFGAPQPVRHQAGWRHFEVERRLLTLGGTRFRDAVMARRWNGRKTEPAFADELGLGGNPYEAMLVLADADDAILAELLAKRGF